LYVAAGTPEESPDSEPERLLELMLVVEVELVVGKAALVLDEACP